MKGVPSSSPGLTLTHHVYPLKPLTSLGLFLNCILGVVISACLQGLHDWQKAFTKCCVNYTGLNFLEGRLTHLFACNVPFDLVFQFFLHEFYFLSYYVIWATQDPSLGLLPPL
jgi:hypothetical protein